MGVRSGDLSSVRRVYLNWILVDPYRSKVKRVCQMMLCQDCTVPCLVVSQTARGILRVVDRQDMPVQRIISH